MPHPVSNKKTARISGLLYLAVILTGMFSLLYVPGKLIVHGNAAATYQQIVSSETLFRLGIVSGLACYTFFLFLPVYLFRLLKPVNKNIAGIMVMLAVVSVPISFLNLQHKFAVLTLINSAGSFTSMPIEQIQMQVSFYLDQYNNGISIVSIFWGLWLFPFGYLVFKSGIIPKVLGIFLMLGCFGYLVNFLGNMLIPDYAQLGLDSYISLPSALGEIGSCLWLLVMGAKEVKIDTGMQAG